MLKNRIFLEKINRVKILRFFGNNFSQAQAIEVIFSDSESYFQGSFFIYNSILKSNFFIWDIFHVPENPGKPNKKIENFLSYQYFLH